MLKMLLGPDEVKMKSSIWFKENKDFLKEQEGEYITMITKNSKYG